ncbi:TolC family protein [Psychroflexus sediminis]|uniref:Outer membrane protein TolC n=1 Tax=Psychroflexus sediminis TaxID=470826 RepID=A0A1G7UE80_9FLAO|nr:TolC family protein [Psychroflexus sediminis]SDG45774.1 Outer membrane protein TolC [Psychroflexus sediminis]
MFNTYPIKSPGSSLKLVLIGLLFCLSFNLNGQSLEDLKTTAAENNLELKTQYKRFEAQLEGISLAKSWQDPNLSFGYFISPIETRVGPQIARFSLTQMLPWFGTFKVKGDIAAYKAEAEFEKFQDQKLKLYLKVAQQYYELSALRYVAKIEEEQFEILKDLKSIVESNFENNKANLVDILRVELEMDKQLNVLQVLKDQDQALVTQLNQMMNRPLEAPVLIPNPKQTLEQIQFMESDTLSITHPRLERIRSLQDSNAAESELAQKQALPQFGLGLDYAIIQNQNVMNADAGQDAIMPMLSVSLPIFGKKNKSRKKAVSLQGEAIQFQLENEKTLLRTEIQVAKYKQDELFDRLDLYEKQLLRLKDILQLSEVALANASMEIEEVLRLYQERLLYLKQQAQALANLQKTNETLGYLTSNSAL